MQHDLAFWEVGLWAIALRARLNQKVDWKVELWVIASGCQTNHSYEAEWLLTTSPND